jgi:hypothetical protein
MLAASVPCSVEKSLGDHGRHYCTLRVRLWQAVANLDDEARTVVHGGADPGCSR